MKKWLIFEILILVAALIAALVVAAGLPAFAPDTPDTTPPSGESTTQTTTETTEPAPTWMNFPENRELTAKQAFVYDFQKGEFAALLGNPTDRVYPASITKLFTAYVALQYVQPEDQITAGDVLSMVYPGSSVANIEKGDVLSVEQLVEAMLLPSGNDAAYLLAEAAGKALKQDDTLSASQAVTAFMEQVNSQAAQLGMTGTHFDNPDGIHTDNHYTTFSDLVILGQKCLENETIMKYAKVSSEEVTLGGRESAKWENTNSLIVPASPYYCPWATGLKTGQTPSAGSCLLSSFDVEGARYLIGVFGCPEIEDRFEDTLQLLNQALGIAPLSAPIS